MQNTCPPGAILRPFRGRRHFENAIWRTFPGKSRPVEDILYIHRARPKKCIASAPGNALSLLLQNAPPSPHEMSRLCIRHMLSRPMECKTPVRRARYCGLFAAVGILKMPSGALFRENRGRWRTFYISTGRAQRNASPQLLGTRKCTASAIMKCTRLHFTKSFASAFSQNRALIL